MKIERLESGLQAIQEKISKGERIENNLAASVHEEYEMSARNLYRYLILRSFDLRKYHDDLSELGISSLRTAEGYVLSNLLKVRRLLALHQDKTWTEPETLPVIGYKKSKKLLRKHANRLFNEKSKKHFTEIMVTLPNDAADDRNLIRRMVLAGMEIARINLSHGDIRIWQALIDHIRSVSEELDMQVKIYMDLSGPKIRTSDIEVVSAKGNIKKAIKLKVGDHLILTKRETLGKETVYGEQNELVQMAEVGVLLPEIIDDIKEQDTVYFDDGMIKAIVIDKKEDEAEIVITDAFKSKLSAHKGINLPATKLTLPSLTDRDIELLPFVSKHADIVGYSFVRTAEDVERLYEELEKCGAHDIGVVFKIENREAFVNLPQILLAGMKRPKIGVMIARGDLAVEVGFERISELQQQILWICEAAHVPVIWATQVLDNLAKTGIPTRAEITDASQSAMAECVMLNKGPYIVEAITALKQILQKMEAHSFKKKNSLRALHVASNALREIR